MTELKPQLPEGFERNLENLISFCFAERFNMSPGAEFKFNKMISDRNES